MIFLRSNIPHGIKNIGNPNFLIFSDNSKGWRYDFWSREIEGTPSEHQFYLDINYGENNWPLNYEIKSVRICYRVRLLIGFGSNQNSW